MNERMISKRSFILALEKNKRGVRRGRGISKIDEVQDPFTDTMGYVCMIETRQPDSGPYFLPQPTHQSQKHPFAPWIRHDIPDIYNYRSKYPTMPPIFRSPKFPLKPHTQPTEPLAHR